MSGLKKDKPEKPKAIKPKIAWGKEAKAAVEPIEESQTIEVPKKNVKSWVTEMGLEDNPRVGSTTYIQINDSVPDPEKDGKKIFYGKWLALFPAAVDETSGQRLASDSGFDSESHGNELRRLIYLAANEPKELTAEENEKMDKIIADNKWKNAGELYEEYIARRTEYLNKRAGLVV